MLMIKHIKRNVLIIATIILLSIIIIGLIIYSKTIDIKNIAEKESNKLYETVLKEQKIWSSESENITLETTEENVSTNKIKVEVKSTQIEYESEQDLQYKYYIKLSNKVDYEKTANHAGTEKSYTHENLRAGEYYDIKVEVTNTKTQNSITGEIRTIYTREIPKAKEELEKGTIVVGEPTWSSNTAAMQLSTTIPGMKIEYQINTGTEGNWTQGNTVNNLKNGDILRIRLTDGENKGEIGSIVIGKKEEVSIVKQSTTADSITVKVESQNKEYTKETGTEYSYYIKKASKTNYSSTPTHTGTNSYTFKSLAITTEYDIKVIAINKAGNKIETENSITTVGDRVARIETTYYGSVQSAVDACKDNTQTTVVLLKNVSEDVIIPKTKNVTLELDGKTITNKSGNTIKNSGTLNIQNGKITNTSNSSNIYNTGILNIKNNTELTGALSNMQGAKATLSGGKLTSVDRYVAIGNHGTIEISGTAEINGPMQNYSEGTAKITGGKIVNTDFVGIRNEGILEVSETAEVVGKQNVNVITNLEGATVSITGGKISSTSGSAIRNYGTIDISGTVEITGDVNNSGSAKIKVGKITENSVSVYLMYNWGDLEISGTTQITGTVGNGQEGTVKISGGKFNKSQNYNLGTIINHGVMEISNTTEIIGSVTNGNNTDTYTTANLKMTGGKINTDSHGIYNYGTVEISGTAEIKGTANHVTIFNDTTATAKITGGKVISEKSNAINNFGKLEVGGTAQITGNAANYPTIYNQSNATLRITGGTIKNTSGGYSVSNNGGTVTKTGGTVSSPYKF